MVDWCLLYIFHASVANMTVNTASRMESNGAPGRIHMSQETADLLIAAKKASMVEKRKDLISAKGKGELQVSY